MSNKQPKPILIYAAAETTELVEDDIRTCLNFVNDELVEPISEHDKETVLDEIEPGESPAVLIPVQGREREIIVHADQGATSIALSDILQNCVENPELHHHLVVTHPSRVTRGSHEIDIIETLVDETGVTVHFPRLGISIHSGGTSATLLAALAQQTDLTGHDGVRSIKKHPGGRPPLGWTSVDGQLQPAENHAEVCRVLQSVLDGEMSKNAAANELDTTWKTIDSALDRPELYGLD